MDGSTYYEPGLSGIFCAHCGYDKKEHLGSLRRCATKLDLIEMYNREYDDLLSKLYAIQLKDESYSFKAARMKDVLRGACGSFSILAAGGVVR